MARRERHRRGKAVQVEHIRFDPGLKALGCQPVESTSPFKVLVSDCQPAPPYIVQQAMRRAEVGAEVQARPQLFEST